MKKYLLILFAITFLAGLIFVSLQKEKIFAQYPSFEIYCKYNCVNKNNTPYPTILSSSINVNAEGIAIVQAYIKDVSGISSVVVENIEQCDNASGACNTLPSFSPMSMQTGGTVICGENTTCLYVSNPIDTSGWDTANYTFWVDIVTYDKLANDSGTDYNKLMQISLSGGSCAKDGGSTICVSITKKTEVDNACASSNGAQICTKITANKAP